MLVCHWQLWQPPISRLQFWITRPGKPSCSSLLTYEQAETMAGTNPDGAPTTRGHPGPSDLSRALRP